MKLNLTDFLSNSGQKWKILWNFEDERKFKKAFNLIMNDEKKKRKS